MKTVSLPFGRERLDIQVPDDATILEPPPTVPLTDPGAAVLQSLLRPIAGPPLPDRVRAGQTVAVVISDLTRPVPNQVILPPVFAQLRAAGIRDQDVTVVNGTGLHRANSEAELQEMLGSEIRARYRIVQHDARERETLVEVGRSPRGVPVELCRAYVEADVRVVTGFVEPHLFAGYSGGAKGVMPAVAGAEIIASNHGAANLSHPRARWCTTSGNPVFEEMQALVGLCPPHFLLNITLDHARRVTGVFAGDLAPAHEAAMEQAARQYQAPITAPFDVVVVTNMGYPADTTLYQSVKGISVAAEAVRDGGAILLIAGCEEGLGGADYVALLKEGASPAALLDQIRAAERPRHDQWQVQIQAMVQARAEVWLRSQMSRAETGAAHLLYAEDASVAVQGLVARAREQGRPGTVLVLPHGQLTVPVVV